MFALIALMGNSISTDAEAASSSGSVLGSFLPLIIMVLVFYFLLIRPQRKKDKEAKAMIDALKKGDRVVSIGGICGTVTAVRDNTIVIKCEGDTKLELTKNAISQVATKQEPVKTEDAAKKTKKAEEVVEAPKAEVVEQENK